MLGNYLQELNQRKDRAWKVFYADYYVALCAYADKFLREPSEAEDVVQEVCIKIWEVDTKFANLQEFTWYVYKSVYTKTIDHLRARSR